jgi:response regulator receiver domain-containing protein
MATPGMSIQPANVLVVDDERHIARFLEFVLKKAGYEVAVAHNGEQALAAVDGFEPDAVLLDLVLPGISGLEVLKRLRSDKIQHPNGGRADTVTHDFLLMMRPSWINAVTRLGLDKLSLMHYSLYKGNPYNALAAAETFQDVLRQGAKAAE